jgi:hypothetical protein
MVGPSDDAGDEVSELVAMCFDFAVVMRLQDAPGEVVEDPSHGLADCILLVRIRDFDSHRHRTMLPAWRLDGTSAVSTFFGCAMLLPAAVDLCS